MRPSRPNRKSRFYRLRHCDEIWHWPSYDDDSPGPMARLRFPKLTIPKDHPAFLYLNDNQHDAGVFGFEMDGDSLLLKMNDYDGWRLATAMQFRLGHRSGWGPIDTRVPAMPFTYRFEGLKEFHVYQDDYKRKLSRLRTARSVNLERIRELENDRPIELSENAVATVFCFRGWRRIPMGKEHAYGRIVSRYSCSPSILVAIEAERLVVEEHQAEAWMKLFGGSMLPVWEMYMAARRERGFIGFNEFEEFLDEVGAPSI
ncbi:MAG: hypothetical protein ABL949_06765 [Fimbriimonadaceae bacterium]